MMNSDSPVNPPPWIARLCGFFVLLIGLMAVVGWVLDIPVLRSVMPGWVAMRFNVALAFSFAGIALILAGTRLRSDIWYQRICNAAEVFAVLVSLLGVVGMVQYVLGINLQLEHIFRQSRGAFSSPFAVLSPSMSVALILFAPAFLLGVTRRSFILFQLFTWTIFGIGWLGCGPYFYNGAPLIHFADIAINSGLCLTVLAAGLLCFRSDRGLYALLLSDTDGGEVARRLVPTALFVPILLAWLRTWAQNAGWFGEEVGRSLLALANVVIFGGLTWISAARLRKSDEKYQQSHLKLTEWQNRLETALENGGIGTWVYDVKHNQTYLDDSLTTLLGRTGDDLDGGRPEVFFSFVHPEDMLVAQTKFQSAVLGIGEYNTEYRYTKPDGTIIWISTRARLERDKSGAPLRLIGACVDITRQKKTAETLQMQATLFDQSSEGLVVWDWLLGIVYWNRGAENLYGYSKAEALGKSTHELLKTEVDGGFEKFLIELQRAGTWEGTLTHTTKDGRELEIETRMLLRHDDERSFVLETNRDVTERRIATKKLQTQLSRLELLSRITRGIGERHDLSSLFQVLLRRLEQDFPADFCCVYLYDPVTSTLTLSNVGENKPALSEELESGHCNTSFKDNKLSAAIEGELVYEPELERLNVDLCKCLIRHGLQSLVAAPLQVESKMFGVLLVARKETASFSSSECEFLKQLTEHVALAAQQTQIHSALQQAYEDLRQTQQAVVEQERLRALGQMASGIAHDINNALSPVALYTDLLLDNSSSLDARDRSYLEIIDRAVDDVTATVARMREFYRHREPKMALTRVSLNEMAQQVIDLTRARWHDMALQRGIVISMRKQLLEDLPDVMGAENEIREALTNLVFNAVDAMPDGGTLILRTHLREEFDSIHNNLTKQVVIEVADTGIGMDEMTRHRCLEPFFTTKGERGTGLGLGMVYGVIQRHTGTMEIESQPGRGTTVQLIFSPAADNVPYGVVLTPEMVPALRLLVIDDDPLLIKSLVDTLTAEGHKVSFASGGEIGIKLFKDYLSKGGRFDAVITDLGMPYMDGRQVAETLKTLSASTPVILLTGWGQRMVSEGDIPSHVDLVLSKPPKLRDLREALLRVTKLG